MYVGYADPRRLQRYNGVSRYDFRKLLFCCFRRTCLISVNRITHYIYIRTVSDKNQKATWEVCLLRDTTPSSIMLIYIIYFICLWDARAYNNVLKSFFANLTRYTSFPETLSGFSGKAPVSLCAIDCCVYRYYIYTLPRVYTIYYIARFPNNG